MKNFLANMKNKFSNISSRTKKEFAALATVASAMPMAVYADKADTLVTEIVSIICRIFRYIGILLLAWSGSTYKYANGTTIATIAMADIIYLFFIPAAYIINIVAIINAQAVP